MQSHQALNQLLSDETSRGLFLDVVYDLLKKDGASDSGKKFDRAVLGHVVVAARSARTNRPGPRVHTSAKTVSSLSRDIKAKVGWSFEFVRR